MEQKISKEQFEKSKRKIDLANSNVIDVRNRQLGLYGVRKTFENAIDALYISYGEYEDSSAWHEVEKMVLRNGARGWSDFWKKQELRYSGISSTINKYDPQKDPLLPFIEAYRLDVSPWGDDADLRVVRGEKMKVEENILIGLQTVVNAFKEKILERKPKSGFFGF